jgi:hypothetical protein
MVMATTLKNKGKKSETIKNDETGNAWAKNDYSQWGTYRALVTHNEINPSLVSFDEAEKYGMPGLAFYVLGGTATELTTRAEIVAMQLYQFHVLNYSPTWQDSKSINSPRDALNRFIKVLIDQGATISALAEVVDAVFKYNNEGGAK